MITKTKLKHWGSSLGVVVPKEIVRKEGLKEGEEVLIEVKKAHSINEIFGSLKGWKIDSQRIKDQLRKEWKK